MKMLNEESKKTNFVFSEFTISKQQQKQQQQQELHII